MKSLLQDGDVCVIAEESELTVNNGWLCIGQTAKLTLRLYNEDLSRHDKKRNLYVIRVIRKGVKIWENGKSLTPQPINKMMTAIHNGVEYPIATHENMKIIVDKLSELEAKVMELQVKINEILK